MDQGQFQRLVSELHQGTDRQRRAASYKLAKSKSDAAVEPLIDAVLDLDPAVRQNAIDGLRAIGTKPALEFLESHDTSLQGYYTGRVLARNQCKCAHCGQTASAISTSSGEPVTKYFGMHMIGGKWVVGLAYGININDFEKNILPYLIPICEKCKKKHERLHTASIKELVLERDNNTCCICGDFANEVVGKYTMSLIDNYAVTNPEMLDIYYSICENCRLGNISPVEFERIVGNAFTKRGFIVQLTGRTGDGEIDLLCTNAADEKVIVQCKRYKGKVGVEKIRDFYGTLLHSKANKGYFVTTGYFTTGARDWIKGKNIILIDKNELLPFLSFTDERLMNT